MRRHPSRVQMQAIAIIAALLAPVAQAQETATTESPSAQAGDVERPVGSAPSIELRVGVRAKARPFSYRVRRPSNAEVADRCQVENFESVKSGPLRSCGYEGFVVYICDEALKIMASSATIASFSVSAVDIEGSASSEFGKEREARDRFEILNNTKEGIDILCDPATINRDRVRRFSVSVPIFATGIGYLQLPPQDPYGGVRSDKQPAHVGVVGSTNAMQYGIMSILNSGEWRKLRVDLINEVRSHATMIATEAAAPAPAQQGETAADQDGTAVEADPEAGSIREYPDHVALATAFCNREVRYSVGDAEIILENARNIAGCDPSPSALTYTDDRYAVFAKLPENEPEKALLISRFLDTLNREIVVSDSLLDRAYFYEFGDARRSEKLDLFFWSIRGSP